MVATYLPGRDSPEGQELERLYPNASDEQVKEWTKTYGYKNPSTFREVMRKRWGLKRIIQRNSYESKEPQIEVKIITPEIKEFIPQVVGKGDPETQVLVLGDGHAGLKTISFDSKVYKKRFDTLFQSTMIVTNLHRNMYPLNDLIIINVGDNVQGENIFQGSNIEDTECGAIKQIYDLALPTLINLLCSFKQQFKTIKFYGVKGNHGRYSKVAPPTSNWDLALYKALNSFNSL